MKKAVLIPLAFGLILLVVGVAQSYASIRSSFSISCSGRIRGPPNDESNFEERQPQQSSLQLDVIGFLTIIASLGFFTLAYLNNRNPHSKKKPTVT